jgi:hypothetical protein
MVSDSGDGFDFQRPGNWRVTLPNVHDARVAGPSLYLANFPVMDECAVDPGTSPHPAASNGEACLVPFGLMPDGGVFIEIYDSTLMGHIPNGGEPITVDGSPSRVEVNTPGRCGNQVVDEVLIVPIPHGPTVPAYFRSVVACLRGPDLEQNGRLVRAFVSSLKRQPQPSATN